MIPFTCFYNYCLWLHFYLRSVCFCHLWITPRMHAEKLPAGTYYILQTVIYFKMKAITLCWYVSVSLGCISPRSLSLLGRGTGAPQSGIYNLWAAGPRQGAAATQHVSISQCCHPAAASFFFFVPPSTCLFCLESGYVPEIQVWIQNPPPGCVKNISSVVPRDIGCVPPSLQLHLLLRLSRMISLSERKNTVVHCPLCEAYTSVLTGQPWPILSTWYVL